MSAVLLVIGVIAAVIAVIFRRRLRSFLETTLHIQVPVSSSVKVVKHTYTHTHAHTHTHTHTHTRIQS